MALSGHRLQWQRIVQENPLFVPGEDREDPHFEQIIADLFQDRGVPPAVDDRLVDLRCLLPLDQFAFDQFRRRDVHGETADRCSVGQVENELPFPLTVERVVERLVDLHQRHRRLNHHMHMITGDVQTHGRIALCILDHQLSQTLRLPTYGCPGRDTFAVRLGERSG